MSLDETLKERGSVHGDFTDNARIAQRLKNIVRFHSVKLDDVQKEALEAIMGKAARILAGDPNFKDHWHDIQGYAKLAEDRI